CVSAGGGAGMDLEQLQFSTVRGAASATSGTAIMLGSGYIFANTFEGLDLEASPVCVSDMSARTTNNTWTSPYFNCPTGLVYSRNTTTFGQTTSFDASLVRIDTECGLTGWGEAKAQVGSMAASQALTVMINEEFAPLLVGKDPRDITRLWESLYNGSRAHYALREGRVFPVLGRRGITISALSGVD